MDLLSNNHNPDNFNDLVESNIKPPLENIDENWSYDFSDPLFYTDDFLGNYDSSPITSLQSPYNDICLGLDSEMENISGSSSDSGLSSDNLDVDVNETMNFVDNYKNQEKMADITTTKSDVFIENSQSLISSGVNAIKPSLPKVVVQKVPQIFTVTANTTSNNTFERIHKPIEKFNQKKEIKIVKVAPLINSTMKNKNVTIQIKNSSTNGRIQTNPGTFFISKGKLAEVKKNIQNSKISPHSILIPITVKGVKDLKAVKLLKTIPKEKFIQNVEPIYSPESDIIEEYNDDDDVDDDDDDIEKMDYETDVYNHNSNEKDPKYPKLMLTSEEKRLLSKEGITLPQHYPLTKNEERELKRIRRKIRNKISAQDSRKRKKDYVIGLEARVKQCTEENQNLMKRIKMLQLQNQSLVSQMKKMQTLLTKGTDKITNPTTCLMVLLMSLALITAPNINLSQNEKEIALEEFSSSSSSSSQDISAIQNRNLLSNTKTMVLDTFEDEKIFSSKANNLNFVDYDIDERNWYEIKSDAENHSNPIVHSNMFGSSSPLLSTGDLSKESISDGDILDLFSSTNLLLNFDIPNGGGGGGGGGLSDESKIGIRNDNDFQTSDIMKQLNVLSYPR